MAPRSETRQRFLDAAADLFQRQGYHATGLNQLVSAGGAPKGSFYFHFPGGKEQLATEAVSQSGEQMRVMLTTLLDTGGFPAVIDALVEVLEQSGYERGCPLANIALDGSDALRGAVADQLGSWRSAITGYLTAYEVEPARAEQLSTMALASIEGALLLAKTWRDAAPLRSVGAYLIETLSKEIP
ncbi:TetR/AcrR family transcriptional regulator [Nocardia stercoris]|uniref:TetR/AcrR family transcriptional regulator n=1 Tax=Nocardia stercoris TaxID=2483361 RepID=A0A3M2L5G5_9NOCA|nr:TetR/AcrR family transcriptional regulator [Nocardia stercoris]RMI32932.1 TetR/AcrR family transcriptional regulator [Nocardia stercoris]